MSKSTHRGHCQACGSLQMLPSDVLSLHGYKVTFGFFSGICAGAKYEPFEKSCGLVADFITRAKRALVNVEDVQANLRKTPTEPKAWLRVRYPDLQSRYYGATKVEWTFCPVTITRRPYSDGDGFSFDYDYTDKNGKVHADSPCDPFHGVEGYEANGRTDQECLLESCRMANEKKANWLEHEADSLRRYIKWQTERVENWKETELLPVSTKNDKAGFVPTEARY